MHRILIQFLEGMTLSKRQSMTLSNDKMSVNDAVSVVGAVELKQNPTPSQSAEDRYQIRDKRSGRAKKKIYIEYSEKQYFKIYNTNQEGSRTSLGSAGDHSTVVVNSVSNVLKEEP